MPLDDIDISIIESILTNLTSLLDSIDEEKLTILESRQRSCRFGGPWTWKVILDFAVDIFPYADAQVVSKS